MTIVSVSRRTDIPAFYTNWFINRINEGYVLYPLPCSDKLKYLELTPNNIDCFVFWSKNYENLIPHLNSLKKKGFYYYFNFTINNYPEKLEQNIISTNEAVEQVKFLSELTSPDYINWRYDPIITTKNLNINFHLYNFETIASKLSGYTNRCYIEFLDIYKKVERNFAKMNISHIHYSQDQKTILLAGLAELAECYGISLYSCCDDSLINSKIKKAHCVDGELINKITGQKKTYDIGPTRDFCGCYKSIDIGEYGSCLHGCLYCYACETYDEAKNFYDLHDPSLPSLNKLKLNKYKEHPDEDKQLKLF